MQHLNRESGVQETIEKTVKLKGTIAKDENRQRRGSTTDDENCSYLVPIGPKTDDLLEYQDQKFKKSRSVTKLTSLHTMHVSRSFTDTAMR